MRRTLKFILLGVFSLVMLTPTVLMASDLSSPTASILNVSLGHDKTFIDLFWVLLAGILVFFMQAGFALVETGFTRAKNVANIMMKNLMDFALGSLVFWAIGFAFMYGNDIAGLIGFSNFFLSDAILPNGALDTWVYGDWFFQAMFAATAATIVSGAVAERSKFVAYIFYTLVISAFIYPVVGHWIWGGGWLGKLGFYDFAGSTVVHGVGAWAGLMGTMALGPRIGRFVNGKARHIAGHSISLGTLGVFILWLGWFGFNPGSTLGADLSIARIAVTTNLAGAAGAVSAMFIAWFFTGKPDLGYTLNGALAGLVAITAPCAVVSPYSAVIIGAVGGAVMFGGTRLLEIKRIDDPVGAIPVHGFAGVWGTLAVGLFAQAPYTTSFTGLFFGGSGVQLLVQAIGVLAVLCFTGGTSYVIFALIEKYYGLRVSAEEEVGGLDLSEHGMQGYPEFFGVRDARGMMDLSDEQEVELIRNRRLSIDLE